jgi:hypothetical protein
VSQLSGAGLSGAIPSPISQFSYTRPVDTSPQLKRFGIRAVLRSGHQTGSRRRGTNRDNQFVYYSDRKTRASAVAPLLLVILQGDPCVSETKDFVPERTPRATAQPIEIPFTLYDGYVIVVDGQIGDLQHKRLLVDTGTNRA